MPKKKTKETQADQSKAFIEKARELGADKVVANEEEVMRRLARQKRRTPGKGAPQLDDC